MFWIRQSIPYFEMQWSKVQDYCTVCGLHSSQSKCSDRGWVKIITSFFPHWWLDRRLRTTMAGYDLSAQSTITFHGRSGFCCHSQWQSRKCDRTSWYSDILAMVTVWTMCLTNSYCIFTDTQKCIILQLLVMLYLSEWRLCEAMYWHGSWSLALFTGIVH